jgi:Holliday junction resolvase
MTDSNSKGDRSERALVNYLADHTEYAVMRAPASGSATDRELPDVLAGDGTMFYAFETKRASDHVIYYTEEEVDALKFFAEKFGATPMLGADFDTERHHDAWGEDYPNHHFAHPENCYRTDEGNYRIKASWVRDDGIPVNEL